MRLRGRGRVASSATPSQKWSCQAGPDGVDLVILTNTLLQHARFIHGFTTQVAGERVGESSKFSRADGADGGLGGSLRSVVRVCGADEPWAALQQESTWARFGLVLGHSPAVGAQPPRRDTTGSRGLPGGVFGASASAKHLTFPVWRARAWARGGTSDDAE